MDDRVQDGQELGNAMSVPVLGSILAQELICLQDSLSSQRLQRAISRPASVPGLRRPETRGSAAGHSEEEPELVMPGLLDATVAWAANISKQWDNAIPGRAPRPPWTATTEDKVVLRKRQRQEDNRSGSSGGCVAQGPRPAGQPEKRVAVTPALAEDILPLGNDPSESEGEDSPVKDMAG